MTGFSPGERSRRGSFALSGDVAAQPLAAFFRPELGELVEGLEGRDAGGELNPRQLAAGEDVHVGCDLLRAVERAGAQQHGVARRRMVFAPQRGAALGATEDFVRLAAAGGQHDRSGARVVGFDKAPLDPDVEREGAAGEALAVAAVAGVDDQRRRGQPIAHCAARAPALAFHRFLLPRQHSHRAPA